jgi:hypothetical protein
MGSTSQGNTTPQRTNNSTEDLVDNEGNQYLVTDPSRVMKLCQ